MISNNYSKIDMPETHVVSRGMLSPLGDSQYCSGMHILTTSCSGLSTLPKPVNSSEFVGERTTCLPMVGEHAVELLGFYSTEVSTCGISCIDTQTKEVIPNESPRSSDHVLAGNNPVEHEGKTSSIIKNATNYYYDKTSIFDEDRLNMSEQIKIDNLLDQQLLATNGTYVMEKTRAPSYQSIPYVRKLNAKKLLLFYSLLDDFERFEWPLQYVIKKMKRCGISLAYLKAHSLDKPLSTFICHYSCSETNRMLMNTYISPQLKLCFYDAEIENIYLFGKKKKRPGGKIIMVALKNINMWERQYWSRLHFATQFQNGSNFIFKMQGVYYCITAVAWSLAAQKGFQTDNISKAMTISDYSNSEEDDHDDWFDTKLPKFLNYKPELKCSYCQLVGHLANDCCLKYAEDQEYFIQEELNKELRDEHGYWSDYVDEPKISDALKNKIEKGTVKNSNKQNTRENKNKRQSAKDPTKKQLKLIVRTRASTVSKTSAFRAL